MIATLVLLLIAPAAGGALLHHLWQPRPLAATHTALTVGQIPQRRPRRAQAVRREVRA